jgi:activator of HSP90 ATPase
MIKKEVGMIKKHYEIDAPVKKVWTAFVDQTEIDDWGGGPVIMDDMVGTKFSLWGGDIHGTNIEVVPEKRLVQDWYGGDWEKPSRVIFSFSEKNGKTIVDLIHTGVPIKEENDFDDGWDDYYVGAIKKYLE